MNIPYQSNSKFIKMFSKKVYPLIKKQLNTLKKIFVLFLKSLGFIYVGILGTLTLFVILGLLILNFADTSHCKYESKLILLEGKCSQIFLATKNNKKFKRSRI